MSYILSIDPGVSSGVALLEYGDNLPATLVRAWQFSGGVRGWVEWVKSVSLSEDKGNIRMDFGAGHSFDSQYGDVVICEKFTARPQDGFSYTTPALEPLVCEGFLIGVGIIPPYDKGSAAYRDPKYMYFAGGKDKADKKKRMHAWLKGHGFYVAGKQLGTPDADDCRSAIAHALAYLRGINHLPTMKEYFS